MTNPYRDSPSKSAEGFTPCPHCGSGVSPFVRVCPTCQGRLESVRCAHCFSLHRPGTCTCAQCGADLDLEPLFGPGKWPCPRCSVTMETSEFAAPERHECPRCGGIFVPKDALVDILSRAEERRSVQAPFVRTAELEPIRYLACPLCRSSMNRVNFGKVSGVVVDVCKLHGTWFDPGELTKVVLFVANGGFEKTRERELRDLHEERARLSTAIAEQAVQEERNLRYVRSRSEAWAALVGRLLGW